MSAATASLEQAQWRPRANPWLITIAVMLGTFMEVLDTSVANVALPHIAGSLSASTDEATWVLTSYLVSNAIVLPMTGWLSRRFGRKRFLLLCVAVFTLASLACGFATTLPMLIVARVVQGIGGGGLQPIAQAILLESFPHEKRGAAMAAYAFGIIFAPIIGPTIGGWITDNYSWRWVFYINIPVGLLAFAMIQALVEDPPHIKDALRTAIDYWGFGFLALWIGSLQIVLDKGQEADWFSSGWICSLSIISGAALVAFIVREFMTEHPLVNLRIFKNRNFAAGVMVVTIVGIVLYGTTALIPLFLQNLMGYSAMQSGLTVSPRGIGSMVAIVLIGRLLGRWIDGRVIMACALAMLAYSSWLLGRISTDISWLSVTWPIILNGVGVAALFIPLSVATVATLKIEDMGSATGLYNLMRNLGGSMGISIVTTLLARSSQAHQAAMVHTLTPYDTPVQEQLRALGSHLSVTQAWGAIYQELLQQATVWAYVDDFRLLAVFCVLAIPLLFLLRNPRRARPALVGGH